MEGIHIYHYYSCSVVQLQSFMSQLRRQMMTSRTHLLIRCLDELRGPSGDEPTLAWAFGHDRETPKRNEVVE